MSGFRFQSVSENEAVVLHRCCCFWRVTAELSVCSAGRDGETGSLLHLPSLSRLKQLQKEEENEVKEGKVEGEEMKKGGPMEGGKENLMKENTVMKE